jgi:riboflavin kinase/FMN adenylyltransferase
MTIIHQAAELQRGAKGVCVAIGVFDGVHLGHQQVIRQIVTDAEQQEALSVAITFDRHPNTVVAPDRVPPLIYSLPQKLRAIAALGVDATLLIHFDEPFSRQSGEEFIRGLTRDFGRIHSICVGSTFTFGHKRSGNVALLKKLGQELNFPVHGLAAVSLDGEAVSSTRIREAIRSGELDQAGQMLGRGYSLAGLVVRGDQLGRRLGFPTANIETAGLVLPPTGVYAVHAAIQGRTCRAVLNIGYRPTLQSGTPELRVEVHLLDFPGNDLYGEELELKFIDKIRDEQKFPSLEALKQQITRDIATAQARFSTAA